MTEGSGPAVRSAADQDRFYVQLDKHPIFQAWGKDDETSALPTLKDAFIFAACVGWARERRVPLAKRQHVGFWRSFDNLRQDFTSGGIDSVELLRPVNPLAVN